MGYKDWAQLMFFSFASRPVELGLTEDSAGWNTQKKKVFPGTTK